MNQVVQQERLSYKNVPISAHGGGGMLMPQTFGEVVAFSEIMARSQHAIPKHLRDVPGACLAVAMQALRWEMDPFAVASKSYNVKDIIAYEAQLIAAVVHTRAPLKTRPVYTYSGEGQDRRCVVSALFDDGIERSYESPRVADIKTKNSPLWTADTDQQLGYYSIRAFARRYCPEVVMGVYTPEEAETFRGPDNARDVTPRVPLAERLAAGAGATGEGFSQGHVISEIDGGKTPEAQPEQAAPSPNSSTAHEPPESAAGTKPAPGQVTASGAGTPSQSSAASPTAPQADGERQATEPGASALHGFAGLPEDWPALYVEALGRAASPGKLSRLAANFWDTHGGYDRVKADAAAYEKAEGIYAVFRDNFGPAKTVEREAALKELGVV